MDSPDQDTSFSWEQPAAPAAPAPAEAAPPPAMDLSGNLPPEQAAGIAPPAFTSRPQQAPAAPPKEAGFSWEQREAAQQPEPSQPLTPTEHFQRHIYEPISAAAQGTQQMLMGNLGDTIAQGLQGIVHSMTGAGPDAAQTKQILDERSTQLMAQYPKSTLVGDALGVAGLVGAGGAAESAAAAGNLGTHLAALSNGGFWGKAAVSGLISAGMNAYLGAAGGSGLEDRLKQGGIGALIGGGLGVAGSAASQGLGKLAGKAVSPATHEAAESFGLDPHAPLTGQSQQYAEAAHSIVPHTPGTPADIATGVKQNAYKAFEQALHEANAPEAFLSDDGVNSITLNVAKSWQQDRPYANMNTLSGDAAKAWDVTKNFKNQTAVAGQTSLQNAVDYMQELNRSFNVKDPDYMTIHRAASDWFNGLINSASFSDSPAAGEALKAANTTYRSLYAFGSHLKNNAVGQILNKNLPTADIANWATNFDKNGLGQQAADVLEQVELIKGEGSPWWKQLQSQVWDKVAAQGAFKNNADLANRLENYAKSRIGLALNGQAETARALQLADVIRAMPSKAAAVVHGQAGHGMGATAGAALGFEESKGEDWLTRAQHMALGAVGGYATTKILPPLQQLGAAAAARSGPAVRWGAPLAYPVGKQVLGQPQARGGSATIGAAGVEQFHDLTQTKNTSGNRNAKPNQGKQNQDGVVHSKSPSIDRAMSIARKYQEGGDVAASSGVIFLR